MHTPTKWWRPRFMLRRSRENAQGKHVLSFGARVGYWPCLKAPFLNVAFGVWVVEVWIGLPSYNIENPVCVL